MDGAVCAVSLALAWLVVPSAGLAQSSPASSGPPPSPALQRTADAKRPATGQAAGAVFVTYARALARGDYAMAGAHLSKVLLRKAKARSLTEARKGYVRYLRASTMELDEGRLRSLASTRVVKVRVKHRHARVTVQTMLYGVQPRATGTAVREDGRWKIATLPAGAHVGRSLVEEIPSPSMLPTLRAGDSVLVDQDAYHQSMPTIGDIVVFHPPAGSQTTATHACATRPPSGQACATPDRRDAKVLFIKRIVAGPGDRISIHDGHVIRNGTPATEEFVTPCDFEGYGCELPRTFTVAAGRYYVLGDNRGESDDSRFWGPIAATSIIGRVQRLGP